MSERQKRKHRLKDELTWLDEIRIEVVKKNVKNKKNDIYKSSLSIRHNRIDALQPH